jgi:hypothetical protein
MTRNVVLLSIPGLRESDLGHMPRLSSLCGAARSTIAPSFPAVTCPVQANMTTGVGPARHGVVANGFFWRDKGQVEMWTAWNDCIKRPQIWDLLHDRNPQLTSAVWFPMHSKGCGADYICTPAPIHNPDGSESLWCYTKPEPLYGELRDAIGHFPLQHFWGPLANIKATAWIADSAVEAARRWRPRFFYIYLPHLDYAAQKTGPDSPAAHQALADLDETIGRLSAGFAFAYEGDDLVWLAASEYAIAPVNHVTYPNRLLREAGLISIDRRDDGEHLDVVASRAWALVDHQFSHVFVKDADPAFVRRVVDLFSGQPGVASVLHGASLAEAGLNHARSGEVVLVSTPNSWQAYYWWRDDALAPGFARTVDIHKKPGYDPVELHIDMATKSIPLDATLVRGSHGASSQGGASDPAALRGVAVCSHDHVLRNGLLHDIDIAGIVTGQFKS